MAILKKIFLLFLFSLSLGIVYGAYYIHEKGFSKKWRELICQEFAKNGIHLSLKKLTLDPMKGLVMREVKLFADQSHENEIASINKVTLDLDYTKLLKKEITLNTVDLYNAQVSLPIDPIDRKKGEIHIKEFSTRASFQDGRLVINQARGMLYSLFFHIQCDINFSPKKSLSSDQTHSSNREKSPLPSIQLDSFLKNKEFLSPILKKIKQLEFENTKAPHLYIHLTGNIEEPDSLKTTIKVNNASFTKNTYTYKNVNADIVYQEGVLDIDKFYFEDDIGHLYAQGNLLLEEKVLYFDITSSIDPKGLLWFLVDTDLLTHTYFYEPPALSMTGEIKMDHPGETPFSGITASGSLHCPVFVDRGTVFENFHVDYAFNQGHFYLRNINLNHTTGNLKAQAMYNEEGIRYVADLTLDPTILIPYFRTQKTKDFLHRWKFKDHSTRRIQIETQGKTLDPRTWNTQGHVDITKCFFNGVSLDQVKTDFEIKNRIQFYKDFTLVFDYTNYSLAAHTPNESPSLQGILKGEYAEFDPSTKITSVKNVHGKAFPGPAVRMFRPHIADFLERYRFHSPPSIALTGTFDRHKKDNNWKVTFTSEGQMDYDFLKKTFPLQDVRGEFDYIENRLDIHSLQAKLFHGNLEMKANLTAQENAAYHYNASIVAREIGFKELAHLYSDSEETVGKISGFFHFTGIGKDTHSLNGNGKFSLENGNLFSIPIFGPLSGLIKMVIPNTNVGYSIAKEAHCTFTSEKGILSTKDFEALTGTFRFQGEGTVDTTSKEIDFETIIKPRGPGILLFPLSYLLKYKCEGTIDAPQWRPLHFSKPSKRKKNGQNGGKH